MTTIPRPNQLAHRFGLEHPIHAPVGVETAAAVTFS